jgi:hypothetical protein
MRIYISHPSPPGARGRGGAPPRGAWSARFGEETLLLSDETREVTRARAPSPKSPARGRFVDAAREELHVVVQNGRLFQQHHPEVPVIHDRGRFLLVKLAPERARSLAADRPTCYGVTPLADGEVVFEARAARAASRPPLPFVRAAVNRLQRAGVEATLTRLVSYTTRHSTSGGFDKAATWARQQLTQLGFQTRTQAVPVGGGNSRNVIADKPGAGKGARRVVLVTAHLDSINLEGGSAAPAPGADDNASGCAGLLEIGRALGSLRNSQDLRLILFGGEEQGLFGSTRYVASLAAAERSRILAVVNMDMIGTLNAQKRSLLVEGAPVSQSVITGLGEAAATYTQLAVETSLKPAASDHVPFIKSGVPAVLAIEGADNANHNIHSGRDVLANIDYDFSLEILRAVTGFVAGALGEIA